jgi:Ca-activated chloride channel family protein
MDETLFANFHFLRPAWLLLLPVWGLLAWYFPRAQSSTQQLERTIAPQFRHLLIVVSPQSQSRRNAFLMVLTTLWLIGTLALAGPAWQRLPQPVLEQQQFRVIVLDLSYSMLASDLQPSRLERARFKTEDLLNRAIEGQTALVVYAGDAHTLVPLTHDVETIRALLPSLHPSLMPVRGSRPDKAFLNIFASLKASGIASAHIIWMTDGVEPDQVTPLRGLLSDTPHQLSVLAIGTREGAPIVLDRGNYLKDTEGRIVVPQTDFDLLQEIAQSAQGQLVAMQFDDSDVRQIFDFEERSSDFREQAEARQTDQWREEGPWLVALALPLVALLFRRGWLFVWLWLAPLPVKAVDWGEWFLNQEQRAFQQYQAGDAETAAKQFQSPVWRGVAEYQAGQYEAAAESFGTQTDATQAFNRGNAHARAGQLSEALAAYEEALTKRPDWDDARFNRDLVAKLLEESSPPEQNESERSSGGNPNRPPEGSEENGEGDQNQSASSTDEAGSEVAPEESESTSGDSAQDQPSAAEAAPEEQRGSEESTGEPSASPAENNSEAGAASGVQSAQARAQENPSKDGEEPNMAQTEAPMNTETPTHPEETEGSPNTVAASEREQSLEQWLRRIPDDPGQLLRNKMRLDALRRQRSQTLEHETKFW